MNAKDPKKSTQVIHREYTDDQGNLHTEYKDSQGNLRTEYKDAQGNLHTEYTDYQGNLHTEYKDSQGNLHAEYTDYQGNLHTEYKDSEGNRHTGYKEAQGNLNTEYKEAQGNLQLAEEHRQDIRESRVDNNVSRGILIGVIVTCVAGLSAGAIYFFTQQNNQQPIFFMNERMDEMPERTQQPSLPLEQVPIVEQPTVKVVPVPQAQTPKPTEKIPAQPNAAKPSQDSAKPSQDSALPVPKPTVVQPSDQGVTSSQPSQESDTSALPSDSSATNSNLSKTDSDLKKEILMQFDNSIPNHKLTVEVKNGEVTVSGTVATPEQLQQIEPLLKSVEGIGKVDMTATLPSKI
jgi:Skp family chaperone for outer membrane proteins